MVNVMDKNQIISMHKQGESIKSISKKLGIARNTVRRYTREHDLLMEQLSQENDKAQIALIQETICSKPVRKISSKKKNALTPEVEQRIKEMIQIDEERNKKLGPNKQQLTAAHIYRQLKGEGFTASESTIRAYYRKLKDKTKECFIKQHYEYGQVAQYDFHQVKVVIDEKLRIYHQATISLPKSNIKFSMLFRNEKMESFILSLVIFFSFCGGVVRKIIFDNMSTAVKRFCFKNSKEKEYTDDLIKISNYYGFVIETCNPRRGNEKGHVETGGKEIRRNLFCLKYKFDSEEELFDYFEKELKKYNQPFLEEFKKEQEHLLSLPVHPYELGRLQYSKVNKLSLISVDGNFYSVPDCYVEKRVLCNVYSNHLMVYDDKNNLIAQHAKKDGKGEYSINILHYIETLLKKPKALPNSYALKQAPDFFQSIFNQYFSTNPKEFLLLLKNFESFDELSKYGFKKDDIEEMITNDFGNCLSDIDTVSLNQLHLTSRLFGQEVVDE
jgi:transposase